MSSFPQWNVFKVKEFFLTKKLFPIQALHLQLPAYPIRKALTTNFEQQKVSYDWSYKEL